jgi:hypothetical protein
MAALPGARELVRRISALGREEITQIVRLSPRTVNAYLRLLEGNPSHELVSAVSDYLKAASRAELHPDPVILDMFRQADDRLGKEIAALNGPEKALLAREHAQRRAALLTDPGELASQAEAELEQARTRIPRPGGQVLDVVAARLQHGFFTRLREVAALGSSSWTEDQRLLISGYEKLTSVIGGAWREGWEPAFTYLSQNLAELAQRGKRLKAAREALQQALAAGNPAAVAAAKQAELAARQSAGGYLSKVKGLIGEAYVPRWKNWLIQIESFEEVAQRAAAELPGQWTVRPIAGNLRLDGAETWDQAILLARAGSPGSPPRAKLFLAAQFKVEKQVTALEQVERDAIRETATSAERALPFLTFEGPDGRVEGWFLEPMPAGQQSHRYVFNASGGRFSQADILRLRQAGIKVEQLNLDVSTAEMDAVANTLLDIVVELAP